LVVCEEQRGAAVGFMWRTHRSTCVIRVLERTLYRFRDVATEASATIWADDGRESLRFNRREGINNDIFDPVGMATRTAAIAVPAEYCEQLVKLWLHWVLVHRKPHRIIGLLGTSLT
jgi:hypothetical protein